MSKQTIPNFSAITESPLNRATDDQLRILHTRYEWAVRYAAGKDVLEVACGAGMGLGWIARVARRVAGGDIDERNCAIASETYKNRPEIEVRSLDAEKVPFPPSSFDVVILFEALYYLDSADAFFREAKRLLRPHGVLLISSVNRRWGGFNPSPFSTKYYDAAEIAGALTDLGFGVSMYGGFPEETDGPFNKIVGALRKGAAWLRLIPNTQKSKEWLKRIFYGELRQIPRELQPDVVAPAPLDALAWPYASERYRFVYCAASVGGEESASTSSAGKGSIDVASGGTGRAPAQDPDSSFIAFRRGFDALELGDVSMPAGLHAYCWRPRLFHPSPPYLVHNLGVERMISLPALIFFYAYAIRRGAKSAYRIVIATDGSRKVGGFALMRHGDFRFPFMAPQDIQLGPVWTAPGYRGLGLAAKLCRLALRELTGPAGDVWWLCRNDNEPSKVVARKLGLQPECQMSRKPLLGLTPPHFYAAGPKIPSGA